MTWHVRPSETGDEAALAALWERVFGRPMTVEHWRWKLMSRTSPAPPSWLAADDDGQVVGHYGGIPIGLKLAGRVVPAFASVDAMVDPGRRREGVVTALLDAAHSSWTRSGAAAAMGLPNERLTSYRSAAVESFPLRWMRVPVRLDEVVRRPGRLAGPLGAAASPLAGVVARARRRTWPTLAGPATVRRVDPARFDWTELDAVWAHVSPTFECCVERDAAWWRWRFADCPTIAYTIWIAYQDGTPVGAAALRVHADGGARRAVLAELFAPATDRTIAGALLRTALEAAWDQGVGTLHALAPPGSFVGSLLESYGFRPQPAPFTFMHIPLGDSGQGISGEPSAWHMTGAEFDVV